MRWPSGEIAGAPMICARSPCHNSSAPLPSAIFQMPSLAPAAEDYAVIEGIANVDTIGSRKPHTHHITMKSATVTVNPTDCPSGSPAYTPQFELTGLADVSGNGGFAFSQVPLQVCIDGGAAVQYSNITMVFTTPSGGSNAAAGHFGSQPICPAAALLPPDGVVN